MENPEETPCDPLGVYGALKFAGEKMVIAYNQVFGLAYTIVRPSALYGPRCVRRRVGQVFIENALQGLDISLRSRRQVSGGALYPQRRHKRRFLYRRSL